ncbi:hypothetical protein [Hansschlegelia plantiphila]|uniref:Uncharacterized protein n=1 Tax=Hansschlegelia plantiphila TaxID=374655 RepID=A0A9W6J437_9HYPH|nr:hypothetical protein [Hansschlegelia plantiphila]GLK69004.1 hypothetical protein GCM10008179_26420 [Hansschlegelia plantiphila]
MNRACVLEFLGRPAGLIVPQEDGSFRFFASVAEAYPLEDRVFQSTVDASAALRALKPRPGFSGRAPSFGSPGRRFAS